MVIWGQLTSRIKTEYNPVEKQVTFLNKNPEKHLQREKKRKPMQ